MAYYPDLSPYAYSATTYRALTIGWLDAEHGFDREPPTEDLLEALWLFVTTPVLRTRGIHECELCPRDPDFEDRVRALQRRLRDPADPLYTTPLGQVQWPKDARRRSMTCRRNGEEILLGTAEIRVLGESVIYAAPTLVYHYVAEHHYRPPGDFVHAVLTGPRPSSDGYRARLQQLEIE